MSSTSSVGMSRDQFEAEAEAARPVVVRRVKARFKDEQLADEVTQDCLTDAARRWEVFPTYFVARSLLAWVTQRAYWRAQDRLEGRGRLAPLADEHDGDESDDRVKTPEAYAVATPINTDREQTWQQVHDALGELDDQDRTIIVLSYFDHLTDQAIGTRLYGADDGTPQARGLRVFRRRQKAQKLVGEILLARGFDLEAWLASLAV